MRPQIDKWNSILTYAFLAFTNDEEQYAPNISLNFQDPGEYTSLIRGEGLFWRTLIVGCLGVIIQLTVIVYQGLATYYLPYETKQYAKDVYFPVAVAGTFALTVGMFLCSRIVETSTAETVMKVKAGARIFWLQRCSVVNDDNFEFFLIFTDKPHIYYVTSRKKTQTKPTGAASKLLLDSTRGIQALPSNTIELIWIYCLDNRHTCASLGFIASSDCCDRCYDWSAGLDTFTA